MINPISILPTTIPISANPFSPSAPELGAACGLGVGELGTVPFPGATNPPVADATASEDVGVPAATVVDALVVIDKGVPLSRHRSCVNFNVFWKSSGEQLDWMTGRRESRKDVSRQMQGKSVSWQPVEVKAWRAGVVAQDGTSVRDWVFAGEERVRARKGMERRVDGGLEVGFIVD